MPNQPLQPFAPPTLILAHLPGMLSYNTVVVWLFCFVLVFWMIYSLVAIYHWLKYSHASWVALPAIGIHLFVSLVFIAFALSGVMFL
jgi:hypothetical protein